MRSGPSRRDFELVSGLKRYHGSAVNPAGPVLAGLDLTKPNGFSLRGAFEYAVSIPHSSGTFHFAFLSLELEKSFGEALFGVLVRSNCGRSGAVLSLRGIRREPAARAQVENVA